jgi:hypothetical protein
MCGYFVPTLVAQIALHTTVALCQSTGIQNTMLQGFVFEQQVKAVPKLCFPPAQQFGQSRCQVRTSSAVCVCVQGALVANGCPSAHPLQEQAQRCYFVPSPDRTPPMTKTNQAFVLTSTTKHQPNVTCVGTDACGVR